MNMDGGRSDADSSDTGTSDSDAGSVNRQPLCDGAQHLRLWVLVQPGNELAGSEVRVENGSPFLTVDGTCNYWIGGGWADDALSRDRPLRTGKMSDADAKALEESLPLDDVTSLADCPPPQPGVFDYGTLVIRTAMAAATCSTTGARFDAAWTTVRTTANALWANGTPMDGALHVSAAPMGASASTTPAPYAWPIAAPLSSFVLSAGDLYMTGVSRIVDDPDSAGRLRALRDQYLADRTAQPGLYANWDGLAVTDQSATVFVYMRDAIPYEDARGLLGF